MVCRVAHVADGDTVTCDDGIKVRLHGIDAPESAQPYGLESGAALRSRVDGRALGCRINGADRYGRVIAQCSLGADDINAWMVRAGHAWAFVKYSTVYVGEERQARAARAGLWSQPSPRAPWDWRAEHRGRNGR